MTSKVQKQNHFSQKKIVSGKKSTTPNPITDNDDGNDISYCIRPQWIGDGECDAVCNTPWYVKSQKLTKNALSKCN